MSVAAVLTCWNEGPYIAAALESVLAQTASEAIHEILLVDDGSGPETLQVLDTLQGRDPRLKIIRGRGGWGCPGARNRAVAASRAPLLAFLDGDDAWAPDKIELQLAAMADAPETDFVYTGYEAVPAGAERGRAVEVRDLSKVRDPLRAYLMDDPTILPSSLLIRRSALERAGGFDEAVKTFEDKDLYLRLLGFARPKGLPEPLTRKRYRQDSLSGARPDLVAAHAFVVFRAAERAPSLVRLLKPHLAQRAARLGLVAYYRGDLDTARRQAALARALNLFDRRGMALSVLLAGGRGLRRLLRGWLAGRERLHAS